MALETRDEPQSYQVIASRIMQLIAEGGFKPGDRLPTERELGRELGVSRHTVMRWRRWWCEMLPETDFWRGTGATLMPPVAVADLPAALLERFAGAAAERLLSLLRWLSPLTSGGCAVHAA